MRGSPQTAVAFVLALATGLAALPAFAQVAGSSCNTLNKVYSPTHLGHNDNNTYICDGSNLQTFSTATVSPFMFGLGVATPAAGLDVQFPETSSGGVAYGARYQQTLTAAANGDNLTAVTINPTFVKGSYTGVANNGLIWQAAMSGLGRRRRQRPYTLSTMPAAL